MLIFNFILANLVLANGKLKVLISMGLGTNSHIKALLEIGAILRDRNHSVIYSALDYNEKFNKPYQLPFVSLGASTTSSEDQHDMIKLQFKNKELVDPSRDMPFHLTNILTPIYDQIYPALLSLMEKERPDVVLCDYLASACRDAAQMLGIPLVTGLQATDFAGATTSPFITTTLAYGAITTESLTLPQRFQRKVIEPLVNKYRFYPMTRALNVVREKYGVPPESTPFGDFSLSLGLSSSFIGFEPSILFPPHIKLIGPIKSTSHPPLTPSLNQFLETHPKTLYIAFGSLVILYDFDIENIVIGCLQALAEGTIDGVLWGLGSTIKEDFPEVIAFNGTEITRDQLLSGELPHMQLLSWAPQMAILNHESTKLFITHGGLESSFEAILSGTPIICLPFLGDQPRNARKLEDAGVGKYIERNQATPEIFFNNIKSIIEDATGSFSSNTQRMRAIAEYGSRRKESGADAVEEYAYTAQACRPHQPAKFGEIPCELKHLSVASRNMTYIQANLIDVYAVAIGLVLFTVGGIIYLGRRLMASIFPSSRDRTKKDQ